MSTATLHQPFASPSTGSPHEQALLNGSPTAGTCDKASVKEAIAVLMSHVVADLYDWVDCSWAVAISVSDGRLTPVYVIGLQPDLHTCLEYTASLLSRDHGVVVQHGEQAPAGTTVDYWAPRIVVPIRIRGDIRGVLALGPKNKAFAYTAADRELMLEAATHISNLLHSERLACRVAANMTSIHQIRKELEMAEDVQNRFFPYHLPHIPNLDYYGECQPAGHVGGDFFDFVRLPSSTLVASVGDVSGRGVPAAIMMAGIQATLRGLAAGRPGKLSCVVQELNRIVCEVSPDNFYVTLFYAQIDPLQRQLNYVNAGHEAALLARKRSGRVHRLESSGTVLGLSSRSPYEQRSMALEPGDVLLAFTDGITEAADIQGRELCEAGVLRVMRNHSDARASRRRLMTEPLLSCASPERQTQEVSEYTRLRRRSRRPSPVTASFRSLRGRRCPRRRAGER
jgi:hypothetical protein